MADRTVTYNFRGNFANLGAGLTAMGRNIDATATKLTALDKNGAKMRAGLTQIGNTGGRVGLAFAAGVGIAIGAAANFEQAVSNIQAATHETADNMDLLRQAALEAGQATQYSATEAAGAIEELAKAGVSTQDILSGGLTGALNLAAAGSMDVAEAAGIASTAMTQFGLSGSDVEHVADLLAAGAGKAMGSVDDLGMALKQSGLVADQVGLSIEETTGGLAAFASAGLLGSDAGTSFKTMLASLTPNSAKAKELMDELGISAYDAQGNFIGLAEFAGNLQGALAGMTDQQRQATLETIFGSDAVRAASVLYEQGADGIQGWIDKVDDQGYAAETAATKMDNLKGDIEQLGGALETAFIGAGSGSQGPLRKLTQGATDAVNAFNDLPPAAQNTATALAAITAITGGGLWFGSKVINGIADTKQALSDLGIQAGRTRSVMAALGKGIQLVAIIEGINLLDKAFDDLFDSRIDGSTLNRELAALSDGRVQDSLKGIADDISNVNRAGLEAADTAFGWLPGSTAFSEAKDNIELVDEALAQMVESGNAETAAAAFAQIQKMVEESGGNTAETAKWFKEYSLALENSAGAASGAADATAEMSDEQVAAAKRVAAATAAQKDNAKALREARGAARDTARGFITLGDSLSNSKKSLGDWIREMEKQAQALRDFTQNARTAAKRGLDEGLIKSLNEAGPAGALRMKQLANATDDEIKRANKAWRDGQKAIRDYVNMQVPEKTLRVNNKPAFDAIAALKVALKNIPDETVNVSMLYKRAAIDVATGQRAAAGGAVPTQYAAPIPASLTGVAA